MKVVVDHSKCAATGICEALAADVFELDAAGELTVRADDMSAEHADAVDDAVASCPTEALRIVE